MEFDCIVCERLEWVLIVSDLPEDLFEEMVKNVCIQS